MDGATHTMNKPTTIRAFVVIVAGLAWIPGAAAQRRLPGVLPTKDKPTATAPEAVPEPLSDAERVARIQRGIDDSQVQLTTLRDSLNDPNGEYKKAESEFSDLDSQLETARKELQKLKSEGATDLAARETAQNDLEKRRTLAKERFDLAIRERKATQDKIALLEQKLQQDREALNKLLGTPEVKPVTAGPDGKDATGAAVQQPGAATDTTAGATPLKTGEGAPPTQPAAAPDAGALANPLAVPVATTPQGAAANNGGGDAAKPPSEKIVKAQETVTSKQAEAVKAKQQAQSVTERLDSLRKVIENERELWRNAQKKFNNADETLEALNNEHIKKEHEGGLAYGSPELIELRKVIGEVEKRWREAKSEVGERGETLDTRQSEFAALQSEQISALEEAKKKMEEAEKARAELAYLKNPFAPANVWNWIVVHGTKIGATIIVAIILLWFIQILEYRITRLITRHGVAGTQEDRENRARTLAGVLQNLFTVIVVVGALLIVIAESGFNITALLGATAVIGLAVAFGAQNLIRDYFYGFMILMENQYLVNDVVKLGAISGQVERITLRITVLRDLRGTVHFVPHGQITTVSNLTRGWARVVLDVGVAYKEDVDRVMKVLADLGKEMRRDPAYRDLILDEPEISGVDALQDSAVVVRFLIKTRPLKQWAIKREMLRRIKNKFDEVGIEIPFPHQVVYNRFEPGEQDPARILGRPADTEEDWSASHSAAS